VSHPRIEPCDHSDELFAGFPSAASHIDHGTEMFAPQHAILSSGLDFRSVYHPPSVLQFPGATAEEDMVAATSRPESPHSTSSSHSDLSSPSFNRDSELEFAARLRAEIPDVSSQPTRTEAMVSGVVTLIWCRSGFIVLYNHYI
jgi:hypothetical protein